MATLYVRNIPDELYARIGVLARARHRSVAAETITLLEYAVLEVERERADTEASS